MHSYKLPDEVFIRAAFRELEGGPIDGFRRRKLARFDIGRRQIHAGLRNGRRGETRVLPETAIAPERLDLVLGLPCGEQEQTQHQPDFHLPQLDAVVDQRR